MSDSLKFINHQLNEHFDNFVVVVITKDGELQYRYNNWMIAKMLLDRASENISNDMEEEIVWEVESDEEEEE
jgi:hypothetical protein